MFWSTVFFVEICIIIVLIIVLEIQTVRMQEEKRHEIIKLRLKQLENGKINSKVIVSSESIKSVDSCSISKNRS